MANTPFLDLVKPAGTDRALVSVINSNSDKIDTGVSTLSEQIAKIPSSTTCNSLDAVKTYLNSVVGTMADNDIKTVHILTGSNFTGGYFKSNIRYSGNIIRYASTQFSFVLTSREADYISGGMITSTWTFSSLSEQIAPYGESQWVGNVTSIDALNSLITPGRYLRYLNIANVGLPGGWAVVDVSALKGYDNYIQVVTYPTTGESYTRHHPTNGSWTNFASLKSNVTPETISTGITGVVAYKVGRMVFMRFYDFKVASGFSAQLPDSLKPATNMYIVLAGATGTYAGMFTISTTGNAAFNTSDYSKYYYGSGAYVSAT